MSQYTQLSLRNTMNFVGPFLKNAPQEVSNMEPAVTVGNIVLSTMLGPPMVWRQNRRALSGFAISNANTDYVQAVPNFGFIEQAWLIDGGGNQFPLNGELRLTVNGDKVRPTGVSAQFDDNAGNITFRFDRTPDANYTAFIEYQQSPILMTSPASGWGPVPDYMNYIFNFGYLAVMSLLVNDARFPIFEKWFIGRLLAAQSGLSEQQRNIFLGNWAATVATLKRSDMSSMDRLAGS